jgi:hypothetical protein
MRLAMTTRAMLGCHNPPLTTLMSIQSTTREAASLPSEVSGRGEATPAALPKTTKHANTKL